jgi:hypothetical protein
MLKRIGLLAFALALAGCAHGQNFTKPDPGSLPLLQTSRAQVEALYGRPNRQSAGIIGASVRRPEKPSGLDSVISDGPFSADRSIADGSYASYLYLHSDNTRAFWFGGPPQVKAIGFDFWNDKLVAYNFVSDFDDDSSNFDESRVQQLRKNAATKEDVTRLFGPPSGRATFPLVRNPTDEKFMYHYVKLSRGERWTKRLEILFDDKGVMRDFRFTSNSEQMPTPTGPTMVPIFIPRGK